MSEQSPELQALSDLAATVAVERRLASERRTLCRDYQAKMNFYKREIGKMDLEELEYARVKTAMLVSNRAHFPDDDDATFEDRKLLVGSLVILRDKLRDRLMGGGRKLDVDPDWVARVAELYARVGGGPANSEPSGVGAGAPLHGRDRLDLRPPVQVNSRNHSRNSPHSPQSPPQMCDKFHSQDLILQALCDLAAKHAGVEARGHERRYARKQPIKYAGRDLDEEERVSDAASRRTTKRLPRGGRIPRRPRR